MRTFLWGLAAGAGGVLTLAALAACLALRAPVPVTVVAPVGTVDGVVTAPLHPLMERVVPGLLQTIDQRLSRRLAIRVQVDGQRVMLPSGLVSRLIQAVTPQLEIDVERRVDSRSFTRRVLTPVILRALVRTIDRSPSGLPVTVRIWPGVAVHARVRLER